MKNFYEGPERREFIRLNFNTPLAYKVCKAETLEKLLEGYTVNLSNSGLLCNIKNRVDIEDILWLSFDRSVLITCEEIEKSSLIYQSGIVGKVVRINDKDNGTFDIGVKFITRQEKNPVAMFSGVNNLKE
ncbi:MAG: PilZ domain-containing protein [Candidatus Omnitrophica bacterium]|jgi:c-di-GMP-binding flagellar brake protein YcgR|nr:PilZ domain-containing protein [Candidatus Omnitrophota bacterium]